MGTLSLNRSVLSCVGNFCSLALPIVSRSRRRNRASVAQAQGRRVLNGKGPTVRHPSILTFESSTDFKHSNRCMLPHYITSRPATPTLLFASEVQSARTSLPKSHRYISSSKASPTTIQVVNSITQQPMVATKADGLAKLGLRARCIWRHRDAFPRLCALHSKTMTVDYSEPPSPTSPEEGKTPTFFCSRSTQ